MRKIKKILKDIIPPVAMRMMPALRADGIRFEGDFATWSDASKLCVGYAAEEILAKVLDATLKVKSGEAAFERDSVLFDEVQYSWPVTAALMWAAAQNEGRLHVLDFGGALGSGYFQNRAFLSGLQEVTWSIVEQPHYVNAGLEKVQDEVLKFFPSLECYLKNHRPTVILLSSVLQYLPDADQVCESLRRIDASVMVIDRTPFSDINVDHICIQYVPDSVYKASYPMRIFSFDKMVNKFKGWKLVERFKCPEGVVMLENGSEFEFSGLILARSDDK